MCMRLQFLETGGLCLSENSHVGVDIGDDTDILKFQTNTLATEQLYIRETKAY